MARKKTNLSSISHIKHLCKMSDSNLVTNCILQNKVNFGRILNSKLDFCSLIEIFKLLVHIYNAELESSKNEVLRMTLCKGFTSSIQYYLFNFNSVTGHEKRIDQKDLKLIVMYFDVIVNILPPVEEYYSKYKNLLELTLNAILFLELGKHPIHYWTRDLIDLLKNKISAINRIKMSYKNLNIYPDSVDLFEEKLLEPKKLTYRFSSTDEYLDLQFKQLKFDYESIVKGGIWQIKREFRGANKEPNSLVNLYKGVTVDSIEVDSNSRHGIIHVITFSSEDQDKLDESWSSDSKKFMHGSLVYFSLHSQFTTFIIARIIDGSDTIVNGDGDECKALRVSVIGQPQNLEIGKKYLMIESTTFFEPYFQTLKAIKAIKPVEFWMKRYIADLNFTVSTPSYLQKDVLYKVGPAYIDILKAHGTWQTQNLNLNESQIIALKAALTNEFTLIQGPPGTGKTHLVTEIINILAKNKKYRVSPIFLVCSRNDSLDHVLEVLVGKNCKVIRLGGQTKSELIKTFELSKMNMKLSNKRNLINKIKSLKTELVEQIRNENKAGSKHSMLESHISYFIKLCEADAAKAILTSDVDVIGATTTGAARLRFLTSLIKPEVVIIEEAAEVLEAHVVASIPDGCKHVILVGDHKQLQPQPAHIDSAEKFNMHISLFERLIHNGMKCYPLTEQFRMRPEIASLISPLIYETLTNHHSVKEYPKIKGISKNLFFINHNHPEARVPELLGRWNKYEADFLMALANYLVQQGYSQTDVTILTGYNAQLAYLKLAKGNFPALGNMQITSIDNYQGKENQIILLSLVRSESATIGFLKKSFRVNVALSRAKLGLYIIGNMKTLSIRSSLWQSINAVLERQNSIGNELPVECQTHGTLSYIKSPNDLLKMKDGGCNKRCGLKLTCGHLCKRYCHPLIEEHKDYVCKEDCLRLPCGKHPCTGLCFEKCKPCNTVVDCDLPCGHKVTVTCQTEINSTICRNPCTRMPCGKHRCQLLCYEKCRDCIETVELELKCGHSTSAPCYVDPNSILCRQPCMRTCANGHQCEKPCFEECGVCITPTTVIFCFCFKRTRPCHEITPSRFAIPLQD